MKKGVFVSFSGLDSAGKTTQIVRLSSRLKDTDLTCKYLWARGGYTPLFEFLKKLLRKSPGQILPHSGNSSTRDKAFKNRLIRKVWLLLAQLDLVVYFNLYLRFLRRRYDVVILDRYIIDTWVDFKIGFPAEKFDSTMVWKFLRRFSPKPDRAFFLTIKVEDSIRRGEEKEEPFPQPAEILWKRFDLFHEIIENNHYIVIDGLKPVDEIASIILAEMSEICEIGQL